MDLEDKADSVHVFITTDYGQKAVSNGILTGTTYFPNGKVRYEWKSNYPIAFYLISIAVAEYIEYNIEASPAGLSNPIIIQNFLYDRPGCLDTYRDQIDVTIPIMELFCDLFDSYPFRTLRNFISRYANDVATGLDFKEVLEETSGMDFTDFFDQCYFGAGYPIYQVAWEQQDQTVTLQSVQTTSSALTTLFKMPMEYRLFYPGGDTTVRVQHSVNEETYAFNVTQSIDSIQIDPDNEVLNGVAGVQETTQKKSSGSRFSIYPNPNNGSFTFKLIDGPEEGRSEKPLAEPSVESLGYPLEDVTVEVYNGVNRYTAGDSRAATPIRPTPSRRGPWPGGYILCVLVTVAVLKLRRSL